MMMMIIIIIISYGKFGRYNLHISHHLRICYLLRLNISIHNFQVRSCFVSVFACVQDENESPPGYQALSGVMWGPEGDGIRTFEKSLTLCQSTSCNIPEHLHLQQHRCQHLTSHTCTRIATKGQTYIADRHKHGEVNQDVAQPTRCCVREQLP